MKLNDNYEAMGNDLQEAMAVFKDFKDSTNVERVPMKKMTLMHVIRENGDVKQLMPLMSGRPYKRNTKSVSVRAVQYNRNQFLDDGWDGDIISEAEKSGMFVKIGRKIYPVSKMAYTSLANRAGITGPAASKDSLSRDMLIAENFDSYDKISLVKRTDGSKEKVFAFMSGDYGYIRQDIITEIIQKLLIDYYGLGKPECKGWIATQSTSQVFIDFPEKKTNTVTKAGKTIEFIPGIMMETSDVGDSSFRIISYSRINGYIAYSKYRYEKVHLGKIDVSKIVSYVQDNILPNITIFPRLAEELTEKTAYESDGVDNEIAHERGMDVFRAVMEFTGLDKAIGKRRMKKAEDMYLTKMQKADMNYPMGDDTITAFDLLTFILSLATSEFAGTDAVKRNIEEYTHRIINYRFEETKRKAAA